MSDTPTLVIEPHPLRMIERAIEQKIPPGELKELFELHAQWNRDRAAERFAEALTAFQRDCPQIEKKKDVEGKYKYAPYEEVMRVAGPILVRYGIVPTFSTEPTDKGITITCRIRVGTHVESSTFTVTVPAGNKLVNAAQLDGQTLSYAKRYALCASLNIVCGTEDNDANSSWDTLIRDEVDELAAAIKDKAADYDAALPNFLAFAQEKCKVPLADLAAIPRKHFASLMDAVKKLSPKPGSPAAKRKERPM